MKDRLKICTACEEKPATTWWSDNIDPCMVRGRCSEHPMRVGEYYFTPISFEEAVVLDVHGR